MWNHNQQICLKEIIAYTLLNQGRTEEYGEEEQGFEKCVYYYKKPCQFSTTTGPGYYAKPCSRLKKNKLR